MVKGSWYLNNAPELTQPAGALSHTFLENLGAPSYHRIPLWAALLLLDCPHGEMFSLYTQSEHFLL